MVYPSASGSDPCPRRSPRGGETYADSFLRFGLCRGRAIARGGRGTW